MESSMHHRKNQIRFIKQILNKINLDLDSLALYYFSYKDN